MNAAIILPGQLNVPLQVTGLIEDFVRDFRPYELKTGGKAHVLLDEKSGAYYLTCHLEGRVLTKSCDNEATLDAADDDDEIYKLNREIQEDVTAFKSMEKDASQGRSFEDLVLEYDKMGIHLTQVTTTGSVVAHGAGGGGLSTDSGGVRSSI